jgi:uncharacterized protein (DUF3084 family)
MLLFIIVLLVAGGVIAYVGDRLGTYIGKKRLTAWGLRPRHTAMLYTVLSGGMIAVLTLFALIGYDRTIQRALLYGPQILRENATLKRQYIHQSQQIRIHEAKAAAATVRALDAARQEQLAVTHLKSARGSLQRSQQSLAKRQTELQAARHQFAVVNTGLVATRATLRQARTRLATAQGAVLDAHRHVKAAQAQYDRALGTVAALAHQGDALTARNAILTQQNATIVQQNSALDTRNQQLLNQTTFLQGAHLIFHKGQEVGRRVIPTGLPTDEVRKRLVAFLSDLSAGALEQGATPGSNKRAVRILSPDATGGALSEDDALDALAQSISSDSEAVSGVVVIAIADYNAFGGEQVPLLLQPYDNVLIYSKGDFIAETTIDGTLPEDKILGELQTFLTDRVQPDARSRGIIPRPDPRTGEPTVGEPTDSGQTLALVKQIQRLGPSALVTARAEADTYSSGPLRLDLSATPPPVMPAPPAPAPSSTSPIVRGGP